MIVLCHLLTLVLGTSRAFLWATSPNDAMTAATTTTSHYRSSQRHEKGVVLYNAYLDSLSRMSPPPSSPAEISSTHQNQNFMVHHAPLTYFALDQLTSKGAPRATADQGTPIEASRELYDDGVMLSGGAWHCTGPGSWPSPNPKPVTEVFYVCRGHGCLTDADGMEHYFGPGDTVVIPKGHTGRWTILQDIHKLWAVNEHANVAETENPIRVKVIHYQDYNQNNGAPDGYARPAGSDDSYTQPQPQQQQQSSIYNVGPTKVGIWSEHVSGTVTKLTNTKRLWFLVLQGSLTVVTDSDNGAAVQQQPCQAGDTVMLPNNFSGYLQAGPGPVKKLWVQAE